MPGTISLGSSLAQRSPHTLPEVNTPRSFHLVPGIYTQESGAFGPSLLKPRKSLVPPTTFTKSPGETFPFWDADCLTQVLATLNSKCWTLYIERKSPDGPAINRES